MRFKKMDNRWIGFGLGLIGPLFGFFVLWLAIYSNRSFDYFFTLIWSNPRVHAATLSLCLIFNLALFFPFIWTKRNASAMGVLLATMLYVPFVLYLKFF